MLGQGKRILFMTAPIGAGHTRAAQAVQQALLVHSPHSVSKIANIFDCFHPLLGQSLLRVYLQILALVPSLYGGMYRWGNDSPIALRGRELVSRFLSARMIQYIDEYKPDAIVCTHATPAGLAAFLRRRGRIRIPVAAVVTDFVLHRLWMYREIDCYYVAHAGLQDRLGLYGVPRERSIVTGIPIDSRFSVASGLKTSGENDDPAILIMGGGAGVLPMADIIEICRRQGDRVRVIAVTGHNHNLRRQLMLRFGDSHMISILGYVDNIHDLMAQAHIIITKPGGMTSSEALCAGLPMIIYRPIPGQEEGNADYLTAAGVAARADSPASLAEILEKWLTGRMGSLADRRQRAWALSRPAAAEEIVRHLLQFIETGQA